MDELKALEAVTILDLRTKHVNDLVHQLGTLRIIYVHISKKPEKVANYARPFAQLFPAPLSP